MIVGDQVKQITNLELKDYHTFTKIFYHIMWLNFPFKNFNMVRKINFFPEKRKTDIFILKVMIKNLYFYFYTNTQYFLSSIIGMLAEELGV